MSILQGTTPSLQSIFEKTDFLVGDVVRLELRLINNKILTIKRLADVTADAEENSFTYHFSEEETLALNFKVGVEYQWRFWFEDGNVVGTEAEKIPVSELIGGQEAGT